MFKFSIVAAAFAVMATPASATIYYACPNSQDYTIAVTIFDEEGIAVVDLLNFNTGATSQYTLRDDAQADAYFYQGDGTSFSGIDLQPGNLVFSNGYATTCTVSQVVAPGDGQIGGVQPPAGPIGEYPGFSFGGNLRDGPGTNFRDVGSLRENDPVMLVSDTGVFLNGYSWWVIRVNGRQSYMWGGLLCAPGYSLPGVYNDGC